MNSYLTPKNIPPLKPVLGTTYLYVSGGYSVREQKITPPEHLTERNSWSTTLEASALTTDHRGDPYYKDI